jgi:hypothetical protein
MSLNEIRRLINSENYNKIKIPKVLNIELISFVKLFVAYSFAQEMMYCF